MPYTFTNEGFVATTPERCVVWRCIEPLTGRWHDKILAGPFDFPGQCEQRGVEIALAHGEKGKAAKAVKKPPKGRRESAAEAKEIGIWMRKKTRYEAHAKEIA